MGLRSTKSVIQTSIRDRFFGNSKTVQNGITTETFKNIPISYTTLGNDFKASTRKIMIESHEMRLLPYEVIDIILDYTMDENKFYEQTTVTLRENTKNINKVVQISENEIVGIVCNDNKFLHEPEAYFNIWNIKTGKFIRSVLFSDIVIHDIFSVCENEVIVYGASKTEYRLIVYNLRNSSSQQSSRMIDITDEIQHQSLKMTDITNEVQYDIDYNDINSNLIGYFRGIIKLSNGWIAIIFNSKFIQCFEKLNNKWTFIKVIPVTIWNVEHKSTVCDIGNNLLVSGYGVYYQVWNYVTGQKIMSWKDDDLWKYNNDYNTCDYPKLLNCIRTSIADRFQKNPEGVQTSICDRFQRNPTGVQTSITDRFQRNPAGVSSTNIFYCITNDSLRIWNVDEKNNHVLISRSQIEEKYSSKFCNVAITDNKHIFIETTNWDNDYIYIMDNNLLTMTTIEGHIVGVTKNSLICTYNNVIKIIS